MWRGLALAASPLNNEGREAARTPHEGSIRRGVRSPCWREPERSWREISLRALGNIATVQQVLASQFNGSLFISPDVLRSRLQLIRKARCAVLPLDEAIARLYANDLPDRAVVLTFDDGLADFADTEALAAHVRQALGRPVTCVAGAPGAIRRIAWCTGGAQSYFEAAIAAGAQAFLTGEISEPQAHYARECGVSFLACGHHATERYGAPAVAAHVARQLGISHEFVDVDNPA